MSSISFPHVSTSTSSSTYDAQFYTPAFDPSSSFQMNPLSPHPLRTPRTSLSASSQIYSVNKEDDTEKPISLEEESDDQEEDKVQELQTRVRCEEVWREMVGSSNGRDKAFVSSFGYETHYVTGTQTILKKLIQYSIRVYLLFHKSVRSSSILRKQQQRPWEEILIKRLMSTMSGLSFARSLLSHLRSMCSSAKGMTILFAGNFFSFSTGLHLSRS